MSCTYLAHHELESVLIIIITIIIVVSIVSIVIIIIIVINALVGLQAKYLPAKGKPGCESFTSDALKQSLAKYQEKCGRSSTTNHYLGVVANLRQVC